VQTLTGDRELAPDIRAVDALLGTTELRDAVAQSCGPLH
jgi:hypothetical protein